MKKKEQHNSGTALKKGIATLLCTALLAVFVLPMGASAAVGIAPGTGTIIPNIGISNGTVVNFAGQEWWVIGDATTGVAPLANHVTLLNKNTGTPYGTAEYNSSTESIYAGGGLHTAMGNIHTGIANSKEQALITPRTIDGINASGNTGGADTLPNQPLWPLSLNEWSTIADNTVRSYGGHWWLRSPDGSNNAFIALSDGGNYGFNIVHDPWAARPALYLNLASVIFASDASGASVKSAAAVGGLEGAQAPGDNLKFTMQDTSQTLDVIATTAQSTQSGNTLQFSYANATAGANQFVSCVLEQGAAVTHYGKLADSSSAASGTLSVPLTGLANGTYTLKIFSEEANGEMFTDFASNPISMTVTVASGSGTVGGFGGTVLSNNAGLASVAGQAITAGTETGAQNAPKTAAIIVASSVSTVAASDIVLADTNATAQLYTNSAFTTEANINLAVGNSNHAYVKVTAQDGTLLHYDVTVTREAPPPAITALAPAPATHAWQGGSSTVTLTGTNMTDSVKLALFNGTAMQGGIIATTGNATSRTASLTLPQNNSTTTDAVYTVKASIDGGAIWLATPTATITVPKVVIYPVITPPIGSITEKGKDATIKFDGNLPDVTGLLVNGTNIVLNTSGLPNKITGTAGGVLAAEMAPGSVVLTLKAAYLDTLPNGTHTVELRFAAGYGTAQVVLNRPAPVTPITPTPATGSPQTGDASNTPLWLVLGLSALLGLATFATKARKLLKNNAQSGK